ncbi:MAG TPA: EAL domain-containing protein [Pusillimonas sp.]|uniref:bifunctional diguanylate cyclase/phosphodiesterase n=1 Tax=Pusillimonas sp. TaxID=3040095 RepID=UPI002D0CA89E|nr:EAL domain-containing protein [Pusillimonas sp.]HUH87129.1 EAL domain-containing protein [Pusillimonas sp.]
MFLVICVAVIPSFAGLIFYVYQQRDYLTEYSTESAERFVQLAAHDESWLFSSTRAMFQTISHMPLVRAGDWGQCHVFMRNLLSEQIGYHDIGLMSPSGRSMCSGLRSPETLQETGFFDRDYFQRALHEPGMVVSQYHVGRISGKPVILVAQALRSPDGQPWAVLYASMDITAMVRARHALQHTDQSSITILDRNGVVLNSVPPRPDITTGQALSDVALLELLQSNQKKSAVLKRRDGSEWLVSHASTGTDADPRALTVVYQHPTDTALENIYRTLWISGTLALLLALLTLVLGWVGIQTIVGRNVRYLSTAAKRLSEGKFSTRVAHMVSGQEFTDIARQLDHMAQAIGRQESQWERSLQRQQGQNKILQMIARNRPLDDTLNALAHVTQNQIEGGLVSIILLATDGVHIQSCIAPSLPDHYVEAIKQMVCDPTVGTCGRAIANNQLVVTPDIAADPSWEPIRDIALGNDLYACWSHPIVTADEKVVGALAVYYRKPGTPGIEELQLSKMATEVASMAIEHNRHYEALRYQSRHDVLTGLYKREVFAERIEAAIEAAASGNQQLYVLSLTLHGFKELNSTLGHRYGDDLLRTVATRLSSLMGSAGEIGRSSDDEFTFLFAEDALSSPIQDIVQEILNEVRRPISLDGTEIQISASIGIAVYPTSSTEVEGLMRHADSAMHRAEREGSGFAVYDATRHERTPNRLLLLSDLRHALDSGQLFLHYQPQISLRRRRTVGFEALLRWRHPEKGLIPPGHFMPVAEFSDVIHPLTLWVLDQALGQCRLWHNKGHPTSVSVNVSSRNLLNPDFPTQIQTLLTRHNLPAHYLEVEITESAFMVDASRSMNVLHRIRANGVRIAIDDFGTGHSSLSYLHKLPVDNLKIDQSFIRELDSNKESQTIVDSIIGLAHNLKVSVTAEGVEDQQSLIRLLQLGCDFAQGYLISRPIPAADAGSWLEDNHC